jgi:hypothetical protein
MSETASSKDRQINANDKVGLADTVMSLEVAGFDVVFLTEARRSADRALAAHEQHNAPEVAGATGAAVLLAAAACEARLSEFAAKQESINGLTPELLKEIHAINRSADERWKELVREYDPSICGGSEFQALTCLFKLRNAVAHRQAQVAPPGDWPQKLKGCISGAVIAVQEQTPGMHWTSVVYVHDVAAWAHDTAKRWLEVADGLGIVTR